MHRAIVHQWIATLAFVATLSLAGARPVAAADLSDLRVGNRLASLWSVVAAGPATLCETLSRWFGATEKSTAQEPAPPPTENAGWVIDPNGNG